MGFPTNGGNVSAAGFVGIVLAILITLLLVWVYIRLIQKVARAAEHKGRNYRSWFWLAFFFLPFAAIAVAVMAPQAHGGSTQASSQNVVSPASLAPNQLPSMTLNREDSDNKSCPFCGEQILAVAKKCKHCGEFLQAGVKQ